MSKISNYPVDEALNFGWVVLPLSPSSPLRTVKWMKNPTIYVKKELTEKQLFNNLKKELKEVSIKIN